MKNNIDKMGKREKQSIDTRKRIIDAGDKVFAKKGMSNTQIKDICKEAGVSIGTFYHYFENKDDLILKRFWEFDEPYTKLSDRDFATEDAIQNLVDFSLYFARESFNSKNKKVTIEYLKARLGVTIEVLKPKNRPYFKVLCRIIRVGQDNNQICKDMTPEEIADLVMIITRGYTFDWANMDGEYDLKEKMEKQLPIIYSSLCK